MKETSPSRPQAHRHRARIIVCASIWLLALPVGTTAHGLVLDSGDGKSNSSPPDPDPGWSHVAQHLGGPSAVYLGCGWMLTTHHVGVTIVVIQGERFDPVAGSITPILNADGKPADLVLFRINRDPGLAPLNIPARPLRVGQDVVMIGYGAARGKSLTVDLPDRGLRDGYFWQEDHVKRWGTNRVAAEPKRVEHNDTMTLAVPLVFDRIETVGGTRQEAAAARGDSGGAIFADLDPVFPERGSGLAGLLFSVTSFDAQPESSSLYGNVSWGADLALYRDQIAKIVWAQPGADADGRPARAACSDGTADAQDGHSARNVRIWAGLAGGAAAAAVFFLLRRKRASQRRDENQTER